MKKPCKLLKIIFVAAIASLAFGSLAQAQYQYKKTITVDHTKVSGISALAGYTAIKKLSVDSTKVSGSSALANFPVLVSITNADLKTTTNGGQVTDANGYDIIFTDSDGTTRLDHELESYDGTTGSLVAWVRFPTLSANVDTVFYMHYGNSSISSSQENVPGVWDSNYKAVWHLDETPANGVAGHDDSTGNPNDATPQGFAGAAGSTTNATGRIDGADEFDGNNDYLNVSDDNSLDVTYITISGWVKSSIEGRYIVAKDPTYTETLRPVGAGSKAENLPEGATYNYQSVDEASPNDDTDCVKSNSLTMLYDSYVTADHSIGSGTINSVTIWVRGIREWYASGFFRTYLKTEGSYYESGDFGDSEYPPQWHEYSTVYTTNPSTGAAWTWDEVDAMEIGVGLVGWDGGVQDGYRTKCTQVWAVVDYTHSTEKTDMPYALSTVGGGQFRFIKGGTTYNANSTTDINDGSWHHIVGTYDGASMKIYIDGVLEDTNTGPSGNLPINAYDVRIGADYATTPGNFLSGAIDEIRISSTARSADWITTEYNNQNDPGGFIRIEDTGDLANFPVLVRIQSDSQLKTTANGGLVTDTNGYDIIFTSDAAGTIQLDHEVESYDGSTGTLVAWVKLPVLKIDEDTEFYLYYCNSSISSPTETPAGVWDDNYLLVHHLKEGFAALKDSTQYGHNSNSESGMDYQQAGQIGYCLLFDESGDYYNVQDFDYGDTFTVSMWAKATDNAGSGYQYLYSHDEDGTNPSLSIMFAEESAGSDSNDLIGSIRDSGTGNEEVRSDVSAGGTNATDGSWHYITLTRDRNGRNSLAIDGVTQDNSEAADTAIDPVGSIYIGRRQDGDSNAYFGGYLDEIRISNTARSTEWIQTNYNNQRWPNKAQWPSEGFLTVQRGVCDSAVPVACGDTTTSSIDAPGGWDAYKLTLTSPNWIKIYTTGTTDTYGHLYDGSCNEIAQDDTVDGNFYISQTAAAGTYYVQVRHASPSGTGAYDLVVECGNDDHGDDLGEATALDCSSSAGGEIESAGDKDYFKVVFWGTGKLTAYTSGSDDVEGALLDDAGNTIAADNDSGGGDKQFQIVATVSPGVYYIEVKHHNESGIGAYTLHVECEYTPVIIATAEYGGSISPEGAVGVTYDDNQSFTITPDTGNTIRDVWVDGVWVGAVTSYEFANVRADHKIVAVFNADFENCVDIPDIPLDAWYRSAPANVMFVLDDSGSMDWEFMTTEDNGLFDGYYRYVFDDPGDNLYGRELSNDERMKWKSQWSGYNRLYYDPAVDYQPWPNHVAGDPALTLDAADPDNPRSHPMHAGTTFNLNATYYQFTSDTGAIIVDDQDTKFTKTPAGSGGQTLLITGFEAAEWGGSDPDGFGNNGTTDWNPDSTQDHSGSSSAKGSYGNDGYLTSNDLDASDLVAANGDSITVDFWFRKDDIESQEFTLYYYDGTNPNLIVELDSLGSDDQWLHYQDTITNSQYFKSNFRISFDATITDNRENVWLDDVVITKTKNGGVSGGWEQATGSDQAYNGDYWWTGADGDYTATWTPNISTAGNYDVYARWHADENHSENVPYTVNYAAGGSQTVTVNQRLNGGKWVLLGTYNFDAGTGGNVTITYTRSGDDDRVCADAVKLVPAGTIDVIDIKRAHYYVWSESQSKPYLVVLDQDINYYVVNDTNTNNEIEDGEIAPAATPPADIQTGRTYAQERQNFANWYQFYRRRELSATAAVARVVAGLKGVQAGFYSINGNLVQPALQVKTDGVDKSKNLLQALYGLDLRAQGTPLRRGLREVGKYYADSNNMIGSSPYASNADGGACQQAFTIVMTDGFWNGSNPYVGNADGDHNSAFDGGAYADIYSDTLADVAMQYYETDLNTSLDNNVPTNESDSATHQHMVTYAVSFGVLGSLNPADYDIAGGTYPVWPDPRYVDAHKIDDLWHAAVNGHGEFLNAANPTELVESLLAITRSIDARIASSSSVSVNGDPLYQELESTTRMYQATYRSDGWIGDVHAYQIDTDTGEVDDTPDWSAADLLETQNWNTGRIIATYDGFQGIPFRYDRNVLSDDQQTALGSDLVDDSTSEQNAVKILNYLRGDRSNEEQNGGAFRDRFQVLGDIVHSSPVYHEGMLYAGGNDGMLHAFNAASGEELFTYVPNLVFANLTALVDPDYSHKYYVDLSPTVQNITLSGQSKAYLVGGLGKGGKGYYALDVSTPADITDESELAARVLWEFPDPQAEGRGSLAFNLIYPGFALGEEVYTQDRTAVATVAGFELSSTGILDLENTSGTFQDGEDLFAGPSPGIKIGTVNGQLYDAYMGYSYSRPVIAKSNDAGQAEWLLIFGNGYDSQKSHAVLYILNLATGQVIKRIDTGVGNCNGLSSPVAIDIDSNGTADYVYAGDLQGNLWKFDLQDADAANWKVVYKDPGGNPAPVFQAKNFSGHPQPITGKPDVMYHCEKHGYLVVFGTGRYLTERDLESSESNTIYGIWDYGDDDDEYLGSFERAATPQLVNHHLDDVESRMRVELLQQTVEAGTWTTTDGQNLRVITDYSPLWGTVDDTDPDQQPDPGSTIAGDTVHAGWYFDLPNTGEMVASDVMIRDGKLLVISFTPGQNPCGSGGTSIFNSLNACTGGRPNKNVFVNINAVDHKPDSGTETTITINSDDWKEISGVEFTGRLQPPVILRHGDSEFNYLSSSTGDVFKQEAAGPRLGIFYWLQVE